MMLTAYHSTMAERQLTLEGAIKLAQEHSYSIKSSWYDSLSADYDLASAKSLRFPTLSLNSVSYYIDPLQEFELSIPGVPPLSKDIGTHENYQTDLKLSLPLYAGGRITSQVKMQKETAQAKSYDLQAERLKVAYLVRKAYFGWMMAQAMQSSAEASLERVLVIRQDVENLHTNGLADSSDLLEAEMALQKVLQGLDEKKTANLNSMSLLYRLMGLVESESISPQELPVPESTTYQNQTLSIESIKRPEIDAMQSKVKASNFAVNLSAASYLPNLSGYGGYCFGKPNRDMFNGTWNDNFIVGLNLNWELGFGGKVKNNSSSAKSLASSALMAKRDLEESFLLGAKVALENLKLAYQTYRVSQREYQISLSQFRLAKEKESAGQISVNRLLELEGDLTVMEQLYYVSKINYFVAETEYLYAIGSPKIYGGF